VSSVVDRHAVTEEECRKLLYVRWCGILDEEEPYNVCGPGVDRAEALFDTLHGEG
jgi:hypothetical protein